MDASEATKGLDLYSEILVSSSILIKSDILAQDADEQKYAYNENLIDRLKQDLKDGRWFVQEILKEIHKVGIAPSNIGLSAAIQRFVAADRQASDALGEETKEGKPNAVSEGLKRFRERAGLTET